MSLPFRAVGNFYDNYTTRLLWGRMPIERGFSFMSYRHDDLSHNLLVALKYGHRPDLGRWVGCMMARELMPLNFFSNIEAIVPVPLHWRRWLERGYNQSSQLSRGIADVTQLPVLRFAVCRTRNNPSQTSKSGMARLENTQGIFKSFRRLPYRHILLVDDVLTTGATLSACAEAIVARNPEVRFSVLTLAKA